MCIRNQSLCKFIILCIGTFVFYTSVESFNFKEFLWDLKVYDRAVNDYVHDGFAYRTDVDYQFVYHPYVLIMFDLLNEIFNLKVFFLFIYSSITIFFGIQLIQYIILHSQKDKFSKRLSILWLLGPAIGFGSAGIVALESGNLTLFLHFLVLGAFFKAKKNSKYLFIFIFQLCILFTSIIKPYFLAYLILLIYLTDYKRFVLLTLITVSLVALIWLSASIFIPNLFEQFVTSLTHQTLVKGDLGYTVFGIVQRYTGTSIGILVHLLVMFLALIGLLFFIKLKGYDLRSWQVIPLVIVFITFLNPRMKVYDFPIAIFFIYMFLFLEKNSTYLKAVFLSWGIATIPLFSITANKLGLLDTVKFLNSAYLFQILGFLAILFLLLFSLKSLRVQH